MQRQTQIIGVDVAKVQLMVARHEQSGSAQVLANEAQCIQRWLLALPVGSIVAMDGLQVVEREGAGLQPH